MSIKNPYIGMCVRSGGYVVKLVKKKEEQLYAGVFIEVAKSQTRYAVGQEYEVDTLANWGHAPEFEEGGWQERQKLEKRARFINRIESRHVKRQK